jgi:hypothetical protein
MAYLESHGKGAKREKEKNGILDSGSKPAPGSDPEAGMTTLF